MDVDPGAIWREEQQGDRISGRQRETQRCRNMQCMASAAVLWFQRWWGAAGGDYSPMVFLSPEIFNIFILLPVCRSITTNEAGANSANIVRMTRVSRATACHALVSFIRVIYGMFGEQGERVLLSSFTIIAIVARYDSGTQESGGLTTRATTGTRRGSPTPHTRVAILRWYGSAVCCWCFEDLRFRCCLLLATQPRSDTVRRCGTRYLRRGCSPSVPSQRWPGAGPPGGGLCLTTQVQQRKDGFMRACPRCPQPR